MPNAYDNKVLDGNGLLFYHTSLKSIFVLQESGKVLSDNNFTNALKTKLDGIATGATAVTVDSTWIASSTNPVQSALIQTALAGKVNTDGSKVLSDNNFTDALKTKLEGIATGATAVTVDSTWITNSTNPVQSALIQTALAGKVDTDGSKVLSDNNFTDALKTKLEGIATGATAVTVDSSMIANSTNPVQSAVIQSELTKYVLKTDMGTVYTYKGSVATYSLLPTTGLTAGDVYNVESDGMNYAWTGSAWDALGASFSVAALSNEDITAIIAASNSSS